MLHSVYRSRCLDNMNLHWEGYSKGYENTHVEMLTYTCTKVPKHM